MMAKKIPAAMPSTSTELKDKRRGLRIELAALQAKQDALNPLADIDESAQLAARSAALARAIDYVSGLLVNAEREESDAASAAMDAYQFQRRLDALAGARAAAQNLVAELQRLERTGGAIAQFDDAMAELRSAGAYLPPEVAVMFNLRGSVARAYHSLRSTVPTWLGLPQPPTRAELAIHEAETNLQRANERLTWLKRSAGAFDNREEAISGALAWQRAAKARLAVLRGKDPELLDFDAELSALAREAPALVTKKSPAQLEAMIEEQQRRQLAY